MRTHISATTYGQLPLNVEPLRLYHNSGSQSGFRNVYYKGKNSDGHLTYIAKVKTSGRLRTLPGSVSTDPAESARHVAAWYERVFGPDWVQALKHRKRNPFRVWYSEWKGGWCAMVWVYDRAEDVVPLHRWKGRKKLQALKRLKVFPTEAAARAGVRQYVRQRYGLFADDVVWRAS